MCFNKYTYPQYNLTAKVLIKNKWLLPFSTHILLVNELEILRKGLREDKEKRKLRNSW